jgi:Zn-dependent protease with chaperone function
MVSLGRQQLHLLDSGEYEHPLDKKYLDALQTTKGFEMVTRKLYEWGFERIQRVAYTGSNFKVTKQSLPSLNELVTEACATLYLRQTPEVYITNPVPDLGYFNAVTTGGSSPIIVITSTLYDALTFDEMLFVIGHEIGHIKSNHIIYGQLARIGAALGSILGDVTLGLGNLVSAGLQIALLKWVRASELTADRAGLLTVQDPKAAYSALMKFAGLPFSQQRSADPEVFLKQAREFGKLDVDLFEKTAKYFLIVGQDHPWTVMRCAELDGWITGGAYAQLVQAKASAASSTAITGERRFCGECGHPFKGVESFCPLCGAKIPRPSIS